MLYSYGIVWPSLDIAQAPTGIADTAVALEHLNSIGALVTSLDEKQFSPEVIVAKSADLQWLGAQAAAHDRVVTWASDHGPIIPLPPFSLFRDTAGLHRMLAERNAELKTTLQSIGDAREYTVRVFRVEPDLMKSLAAFSPTIANLQTRIATASPGQRYLLERKLEAERQPAAATATQRVTDAVLSSLSALSKHVAQDEIPDSPTTNAPAYGAVALGAVVNASFLVAANARQAFQEAVTALIEQFGASGFRFEFTGPWAPYHFVRPTDA